MFVLSNTPGENQLAVDEYLEPHEILIVLFI